MIGNQNRDHDDASAENMFADDLKHWHLVLDGPAIITPNARLLPVRQGRLPAMLKIAMASEEKQGAKLMTWWEGQGAAPVLAHAGNALLLKRAMGKASLVDFARHGRDDEASRIICKVVARLHAHRLSPPPKLIPLQERFEALHLAALSQGGLFEKAAAVAQDLLAQPQDQTVLHGDIHHANILDFDEDGWLAIDPKGLKGERGFDYANMFRNPDDETATAPGRFNRRIEIITKTADLDPKRLIQWIFAYAGLSAAWHLNDGSAPDLPLKIGELAAALLDQ